MLVQAVDLPSGIRVPQSDGRVEGGARQQIAGWRPPDRVDLLLVRLEVVDGVVFRQRPDLKD